MKIRLGNALMWALPGQEREEETVLTLSNATGEVDYENLSDEHKKIVDESLERGAIIDLSNGDGIEHASLEGIENALELSVPKFRKTILPHITSTNDHKLLNSLLTQARKEGKRGHLQLLLGAKRQIGSPLADPFAPGLEVDSRWAQLENIEEEEANPVSVADLMSKFEAWSAENGQERNNDSFREFVESMNA